MNKENEEKQGDENQPRKYRLDSEYPESVPEDNKEKPVV